MNHPRSFATALAASLTCACTSPVAQSPDICAEAEAAVRECFGGSVSVPWAACDDAAQGAADELLSGLATHGCNGPTGKDDSVACASLDWDPLGWCTPAEPLGPTPDGTPTRLPIVLAHGFNTSTTNFWRFNDVDIALENDGHVVALGSVPPFDTPQVRAGFLAEQVDELLRETNAQQVNLICFSMGGIDCRFLASPDGLDYGDKIATITTVSAPHRGSAVADVAMGILPSSDEDSAKAIDALATMWGKTFSEVAEDSHLVAALESMSEERMARFNEEIRDADGVAYLSWAGVSSIGGIAHPHPNAERDACRDASGAVKMLRHEGTHDVMDPLLVAGAAFVAHGLELRPNDGVSTVESSKWGEFLGCLPADHLDQVGQVGDEGADRRTGFDYRRFYRNLAFELAARGY